MRCQADKLGITPQGEEVTAVTDYAGPQVIVKSETVHLLSRPLADHYAAVELGKQVVIEGSQCYGEWYNLKQGSLGGQLFAVFGGSFR